MIKLFAPHPDHKIVLFLPNAEWGDAQRLESSMQLYRSMNGERAVTHIRKLPDIRAFEVSLIMTRMKSLEFMSFFELFGAETMKLEFGSGESRIGNMRINPMEFEVLKRAIVGSSTEEVSTQFDFETIQ